MSNPYEGLSRQQLEAMTPSQIDKLKKLDPRFAVAVEKVRSQKVTTRQAAEQIAAEFEFEEQVGAALNQFIANGGEYVGPYFSGAVAYKNSRKITEWAVEHLPNGTASMTTAGSFEVAFRNCLPNLAPDPLWLSDDAKKALYRDLYNRLSVTHLKMIRQGDTTSIPASVVNEMEKIGGLDAFLKFESEGI